MKHPVPAPLLRLGVYLLAALLVSAIFHSDVLSRMWAEHPDKVGMPLLGPRTDLGDNYHYYSYAKTGLSTCTEGLAGGRIGSKGNLIACTFPGALLVSHGLYGIAVAAAPSFRWEPALTLLLHTALLALCLLVCLSTVLQRRFTAGAAVAWAGGLLFVLGNFALSFYLGFPYKHFPAVYAAEPDIIRILNPTTFWALGLLALAAVLAAIRQPTPLLLGACAATALLLGTASIAVAVTLLGGLGLYLLLHLATRRGVSLPALVSFTVLLAGVAVMLWAFRIYWSSEMGQAFNHGRFLGLQAKPAFLVLLLPLAWGRMAQERHGAADLLMKSVLLSAAGVGMLCDSVEFGGRLWLRGAVVFALVCWAAWLWFLLVDAAAWLRGRLPLPSWRAPWAARVGTLLLAPLALAAAMLQSRPPDMLTWRGYMDRDKFEVLAWLRANAGPGDLVASADIGDSYLVPFYTRASAFVPVFGLTEVPPMESARRYFHTLALLVDAGVYVQGIFTLQDSAIEAHHRFLVGGVAAPYDYREFQRVAFYESVLYYPYNQHFKDVLRPGPRKEAFLETLRKVAQEGARQPYVFRYLIADRREPLREPGRFRTVYENRSYAVLQPVEAR
jgi:hypothetical protein